MDYKKSLKSFLDYIRLARTGSLHTEKAYRRDAVSYTHLTLPTTSRV